VRWTLAAPGEAAATALAVAATAAGFALATSPDPDAPVLPADRRATVTRYRF
jgi:hypothetical protein